MSNKRATVMAYRSDRTVWADGPLRCRVIDLFGRSAPQVLLTRSIPPVVELDLDVPFDSGNAYGISIEASRHRSGWHVLTRRSFLRTDGSGEREGDETIVRPMLVHKDATPSDLAAAFARLEAQGSPFGMFGSQRFDALQAASAKLAFLNLEAKLRETRIGTRSLLSFVRDIRGVGVDRVFLLMAAEVRPLVADSPDFSEAPGHGVPSEFPGLGSHPDSWKHTKFDFGNLQLSFSKNVVPRPIPGLPAEPCFSVDCDIDLERDLGHAFEFIYNQVFKRKTDQSLVYRMLWDHGVLPAYTLSPPTGEVRGARVSVTTGAERAAAPAARSRGRSGLGRRRSSKRRTAARRQARKKR